MTDKKRKLCRFISKSCEILLNLYLPVKLPDTANTEFKIRLDLNYFIHYETILKYLNTN